MDGLKLNSSILDIARRNGWGCGNFQTVDGTSVNLCTDLQTGITRLFELKSDKLLKNEAARGNNQVAAMLDRYAQRAVNKDEADMAFINSFTMFM